VGRLPRPALATLLTFSIAQLAEVDARKARSQR